jgi:hypothetical protein
MLGPLTLGCLEEAGQHAGLLLTNRPTELSRITRVKSTTLHPVDSRLLDSLVPAVQRPVMDELPSCELDVRDITVLSLCGLGIDEDVG